VSSVSGVELVSSWSGVEERRGCRDAVDGGGV
jgi:hypothetical protein